MNKFKRAHLSAFGGKVPPVAPDGIPSGGGARKAASAANYAAN